MRRRLRLEALLALASVAAFSQSPEAPGMSVLPERATAVVVSNRDVNRVHCPGPIEDVVYSAEKPVKVTRQGQQIWVKFMVARQNGVDTRVTSSFDLHIVCAGEVYSLILHPREMDAASIALGDARTKALSGVAKDWGALALEEKIKRLTLAVYRNDIPASFARRRIEAGEPRRSLALFENAEVIGQQEIVARGTGLKATEYIVLAREAVALDERDFVTPALGDIVGITVEPLNVPADGFARLIVIERSGTDGQ